MSEIEFEYALFFDLASRTSVPLDRSLADLSGFPPSPGPHATSMIQRCETAWSTPLKGLTCKQVRLLLGQQMGLAWLGKPILDFVGRWPEAMVTNYPGEMALLALRAAPELLEHAPVELREWLQGDFGWMDAAFGWDEEGELLAEAKWALAAARARAAAH